MSFFKTLRTKEAPKVHAIDGVSFHIKKGEILGLVGESGCGKTTTGKVLVGLLEPTEGQVFFKGTNLASHSDKELRKLRRKIQIIFHFLNINLLFMKGLLKNLMCKLPTFWLFNYKIVIGKGRFCNYIFFCIIFRLIFTIKKCNNLITYIQ